MNDKESYLYFYNTKKIPPVSLRNWVAVYTILTGVL
jgi:hypothetical protein